MRDLTETTYKINITKVKTSNNKQYWIDGKESEVKAIQIKLKKKKII